jgi:hypothetical protein
MIGPHKAAKDIGRGKVGEKYGLGVYHCSGRDAYGRGGCPKYAYDNPPKHTTAPKAKRR